MTKQDKVAKVMHEWKNGRLFSNGKKVTDYDQAIAIALSEAGLSKYAEGGYIEKENALMVANNNKQIAHHTKEMESALKEANYVPAWVVAKVNRSASDLSDATHYLEGQEDKYAEGGSVRGFYEDNVYVLFKTENDLNKVIKVLNEYGGYLNLHDQITNSGKMYWNIVGNKMVLFSNIAVDDIIELSRSYGAEIEKYSKDNTKYAEGGGIGFIPMDLHEELTHIAKFGGVKSEKDVIGILNAIVDYGLTDNDLETKPIRTATQYELVLDKKTEEVWVKVKGNYEGDLKGNQYFSSLYEIIKRNNSNDAKLIERYKPFRKLSKEGELMERGGTIEERKQALINDWIKPFSWGKVDEDSGVVKAMADKYDLGRVTVAGLFNEHSKEKYSKGGNVIERIYVNKDEDYETRYAKDKPMRKGYKDERMFAEGGGVEYKLTDNESKRLSELQEKEDYDMLTKSENKEYEDLVEKYRKTKEYKHYDKFAVGGEIGNTVSFKGDYGTPRSGVVKEKRGSSYIVSTDDGDRLVDSYEVISFSETPIAKKKRFGFFEGGGSIESKKQAILDFINSFPDKPKDWSEATDDLPELHHDIADEYGSKYDFDFNKRSSLRDRNLRHKQHAKSLLNKLSDEEIDKIYSKWEETLEDKYEYGGGIGFIPMDLEEKLMIIAKWGGISIKGVIGILNAMIDSGITDDDLTPKPIKNTIFQIERAEEKKIQDIWKEIQPKYNGTLKGNQYYSTIKELIQYSNDDILKRYKPFRKYQFEYGGGVHTMPNGEVMLNSAHYEGGGEIQSKIDKLQAVVKSKMLPEGVKEKARKKIAELEKELHESKETKAEDKAEENKMTGESEGERNVGMDKPEDYIEAKVKNLEASLKDKTISETQRKRDEKELALFKKAPTRKPTTRKAPIKKAVAKKVVVKKEIETPAKPKADHKKLVAKLKAKKGQGNNDRGDLINYKDGSTERRKRSESSDKKRSALPLGKRVSADGNVYYERRLNRADISKEDKFKDGGEIDKNSSSWGLNLNW